MQSKVDELISYIQENCLWQFFSRAWDREENIEGVLDKTEALLTGTDIAITTDKERCHLADAKILASAFKAQFQWIRGMKRDELHPIFQNVKDRMREIVITASRNEELYVKNY